ncbi:hypothetical protein HPB51_016840 [Rhipicephalus microplus]|uniref:Uncharacterized protein n=1 Tax=Rhipicephalus microplus TaxID=6941 RepID=A0A9J6DPK1_RHIMP|nr:hypothetical protein HPB51_016840 [Rhipicephalus microplus]
MFVSTQRAKDAEAVAVRIRWKINNANRDVDFAAKATRPKTEYVTQNTGLLNLSRNASENGGDKRRKKHTRLKVTARKDKTFRCQRERLEGDPGPTPVLAPVLAPVLGRGALSYSPRLEPEQTPDLGLGAGLLRRRTPRRCELPETKTPMCDRKLPSAIEVELAQAEIKTQKSEGKIRKRQDRLEAQVEEGIKTLQKKIEEGKNTRKSEMEGMLSQLTNVMQQITSTMQQIQQQLMTLQMRVDTVERRLRASNFRPFKTTRIPYNRPGETEAKDNTGRR